MDEGTLNDLLECSVCLERLDTSSKVLPCQHTFCKKCLEEIVQKHKELRCPECRVLVQIKVDELPPNVLLMRILEGMRNVGPKKVNRSNRGSPNQVPVPLVHATPNHQQHGTPEHRVNSNKQSSPHMIPHQPYAKAMYDYASKEAGDLAFKRGDIIILRKRIDNHWYQGECAGKQGVFPLSYVQIITPVPSHVPQCRALYDFRMSNDEEEGCLAFAKGDVINVIRRVDENWAEGKLAGRVGIFPLAFVEMNGLARSLMKLSSNAQPGPSRVAPPTPAAATADEDEEDACPLIPTDHTRAVVHRRRPAQQQQPPPPPSDSSGSTTGSSATPNASSSSSGGSSTAPSSPASPPPPRGQQPPQKSDVLGSPAAAVTTPRRSPQTQNTHSVDSLLFPRPHDKEKRHSFTGPPTAHQTAAATAHNRHSAEILGGDGGNTQTPERVRRNAAGGQQEVQLPSAYIALYPYKPQKADELELRKGGIYMVTERCQDGWYKGTSNRTQKCGVFPGNYVTLARGTPNPPTKEDSKLPVSYTRGKGGGPPPRQTCQQPPELPPRANSPPPASTISSSWHGQQDTAAPLGRSSSAIATLGNPAKSADKVGASLVFVGMVIMMIIWKLFN